MAEKQSLIPEGYTFLNPTTMLSKKAKELFEDWVDQMEKCNPDNFDMYIYNDFAWFGQLDVVDRALRGIHSRIERRVLEDSFYRLEALIFVNNFCADWPMANDGERVNLTDELFGACLVKTLQKLEEDGKLNVETFPNLETVLKEAAKWGDSMPVRNGRYQILCRGIGKRLFQNKTPETRAREKAMVEEWIAGLKEEDRKLVERDMEDEEDEEDDEDEDRTPWYEQGEADEHFKHRSFTFSRVWKEYVAYLKEVPTVPLRGPPVWDLTDWTDEEKAPFLFSNMDD